MSDQQTDGQVQQDKSQLEVLAYVPAFAGYSWMHARTPGGNQFIYRSTNGIDWSPVGDLVMPVAADAG